MDPSKASNINYVWSSLIVEELVRNGVDTFCISPGSRSSPLIIAVANNPKAKSFIHFDERGSAFRALGMTSSTRRPCAVITTSGTAAANIFPAVIEASKKKAPLIVLTADRPPELRHTGAHQTIDQVKIYGEYVRWHFDLPCPSTDIPAEFVLTTVDQAVSRANGNPGGPVHLNCMYREPLAPVEIQQKFTSYVKTIKSWQKSTSAYTHYVIPEAGIALSDVDDIAPKINKIRSGIIVVGKLSTPKEQQSTLKLAEKLNWPVFPDISSGLRLGNKHKNVIHYFDQILLSDKLKKQYKPDGMLHLGGRITSKRWYDYIEAIGPKQYIMALSHPLRNDPLHNITTRIQCNVASLCDALTKRLTDRGGNAFLFHLQKLNKRAHQTIEEFLCRQNDLSEPQTARLITQFIPAHNGLFISNSMPIREADMYGAPDRNPVICGFNRGASGIDGIIASAIGFSTGLKKRITLLTGDLAFLYDLNSLAMAHELKYPVVIVILNNNGGGIFSFLPVSRYRKGFERYFGTPHHMTFGAAADLFGLNYAQPQTKEEFLKTYQIAVKSQTSTIIEIQTDRAYNLDIHHALQNEIKCTL